MKQVLLALVAGIVLAASAAAGYAEQTVVSEYRHGSVAPPDVPACERVADDHFRGTVMAGDSVADGLAIHGLLPEMQFVTRIGLSPRSARTAELYKNDGKAVTLAKKLPVMRPTAVYLWLGTNGLDMAEADRVLADYDRLLDDLIKALPGTPLYLLEATPVRELTAERYAGFTNERVNAFNEGLRALAEAHGVYLLRINAALQNAEGLLEAAYAAEDGIHLQRAGYEIVADYLYTHALPMEEEAE